MFFEVSSDPVTSYFQPQKDRSWLERQEGSTWLAKIKSGLEVLYKAFSQLSSEEKEKCLPKIANSLEMYNNSQKNTTDIAAVIAILSEDDLCDFNRENNFMYVLEKICSSPFIADCRELKEYQLFSLIVVERMLSENSIELAAGLKSLHFNGLKHNADLLLNAPQPYRLAMQLQDSANATRSYCSGLY